MKGFVKTYFKALQIIDMIFGVIMCITVAGLIFGIPLIIGSKKFGKAYEASERELIDMRGNLLGWGIFNALMFAATLIGLIVILCFVFAVNSEIKKMEASVVRGEEVKEVSIGQSIKEGAKKTVDGTKEVFGIKSKLERQKDELQKLNAMKEEGFLTEEEYSAKRKQILEI